MIQANELRIGNWVFRPDINQNVRVSVTTFNSNIHDLKPIHLTEEILLRCGFEKVEDEYCCSYEKQLNSDVFISYADDFSCSIFWNKEDSINAYGVLPDFHSTNTVHGLQNLHYILTGQELKIEL